MKLIRALIAAALAIGAAVAIQTVTSSGADASVIRHPSCIACWENQHD